MLKPYKTVSIVYGGTGAPILRKAPKNRCFCAQDMLQ